MMTRIHGSYDRIVMRRMGSIPKVPNTPVREREVREREVRVGDKIQLWAIRYSGLGTVTMVTEKYIWFEDTSLSTGEYPNTNRAKVLHGTGYY